MSNSFPITSFVEKYLVMKISFERIVHITVQVLSLFLLLTGLGLAIAFVVSIAFCESNLCGLALSDSHLKLIAILIVGGLLGTSLDYVLKKLIKDYVKKYIDDGTIDDLISNSVADALTSSEEEEVKAKLEINNNQLDTVIVPVGESHERVLANRQYVCPSNRSFKDDLKYIAFYRQKKVFAVAEIKSENKRDEALVFELGKIRMLDIPHIHKGAFIQNKMYCNYQMLINAKNTDQIKPI